MWENFVLVIFDTCDVVYNWSISLLSPIVLDILVIFDTCDVVYNWSISVLPPIVLDNLFDYSILLET